MNRQGLVLLKEAQGCDGLHMGSHSKKKSEDSAVGKKEKE